MKRLVAFLLAMTVVCSTGCTPKQEKEETNVKEEIQTGESGYVFETEACNISVGDRADAVAEKLGEPITLNEAASCALGDLDKIWTYSNFTLYSYQEDGVDYIYDIVFTSDAVSTAEGVCIGQGEEDIKKAYGEADEQDESRIIYKKDDMKLMFIMDSGVIRSIEYASTILDR